jgi:hypothetical protein
MLNPRQYIIADVRYNPLVLLVMPSKKYCHLCYFCTFKLYFMKKILILTDPLKKFFDDITIHETLK